MFKRNHFLTLMMILSCFYAASSVADVTSDVVGLQDQWAIVNYQMEGKEQVAGFDALSEQADVVTSRYPDSAEAFIWSGIIKSTYAGAKGGLGALSLAKASRKDLERAMDIDADAMNGSAYTSLGTLYYSVPGWPVGFGNEDKAEELLGKALALAPDDIDANYFYAEFKRKQKEYQAARDYLLKAQASSPRPGRDVADSGRQKEITIALEALQKEL